MSTVALPPVRSGPRIRTAVTPDWVSRVNLRHYQDLVDPDLAATDEQRFADLVAEEDFRAEIAEAAAAALTELVGTDRERSSRLWLPLRRAVLAGRHPKAGHLTDPDAAADPTVSAWLDSWRRTDRLEAALDGEYADALARERAVVTEWTRDPDVQLSTVMTSRSLFRAVASRAGTDGALTKRQRKSEQSLVTYFGRSTTKVSPFSRYTGTAFHGPDEAAGPLGRDHVSVVSLRHLIVRRAARRLAQDPVDRLDLTWRVSDTCRLDGDVLVIHRRRWVEDSSAKSDTVNEDDLRLPLNGAWAKVWPLVVETATEPARLRDLIEVVAARFGWPQEHTAAVVDVLIGYQAIVPAVPVREQDPDYLGQWLAVLAPLRGETSAAIRAAVRQSLRGEREMATAGPDDRARLVEDTEQAWREVVGDGVEHPFVEDCYLDTAAPVAGDQVGTWAEQTAELGPLLVVMDDQRILAAALESVFVRTFGVGGTCRDLRAFARAAYETFPLTQRLLDGQVPDDIAHIVGPLRAARSIIADHLVELGRSGTSPVSLDPAVLDRAAEHVPDREWDRPRSITVFGQPAGREFVVNHLYGGRSRYFSRFLAQQPGETLARVRETARVTGPDDARQVHMRPALGFNANLNPLLAPEELRLTDEHPGETARLSVEDLALVHDPATGVRIVLAATGESVDVLYTGFLVPHALPSEEMLLAMVAGAPYFSFNELTLDLHARLQATSEDCVRAPRIQHGDLVLFRSRWALRSSFLAAEVGVDEPVRHRELGRARARVGLPAQVFARPLFGRQITPLERAMSPRPQFLDLGSRLQTAGAQKRTAPLGDNLLVEEFHPRPDQHGTRSPRGRHATELFYEITLAPGGHR